MIERECLKYGTVAYERERENMNISKSERALIISALEGDRQGTWGDDRSESIKALLTKLKKEGK